MNNFWQRAITGTIFVVVLVGAIVLGGWYMHVTFGVIALLGLWEFYGLFKNSETKPQIFAGITLGALIIIGYTLSLHIPKYERELTMIFTSLLLLGFIITAFFELFRAEQKPFENIGMTFGGLIYVLLPFILLSSLVVKPHITQHMSGLYSTNNSFWIVLLVFILIWSNDTFAYLTGRLIGKHKLFERISPKKTWEGFFGGMIFSFLAGILLAYFLNDSYLKFTIYALIASIIGTLGDLVQSMLKRSVNVKDSGTILPGHGGILDRFDAVLFVAPVVFIVEKTFFS